MRSPKQPFVVTQVWTFFHVGKHSLLEVFESLSEASRLADLVDNLYTPECCYAVVSKGSTANSRQCSVERVHVLHYFVHDLVE